jgi:hypothetical protein
MAANAQHLDYLANLPIWRRARDVVAGEDAIKYRGEAYLPKLVDQNDDEYASYKARACFFNATNRTADGFLGLIFRREPTVKLPDRNSGVGGSLRVFSEDVDLMGTSLQTYCKAVTSEVITVGRCGSLIDWEESGEKRAFVVRYAAEDIINWRTGRVNGRNCLTMVSLQERLEVANGYDTDYVDQVRVYQLDTSNGKPACVCEVWRRGVAGDKPDPKGSDWVMVDRRIPLRLGKPLPLIPFVFHGPRNSLPAVDALPLKDIIFCNLDHYRLDADYKHGLHWTALPTAYVSGFKTEHPLRIGSTTAWQTDTLGAVAGFLEFKGAGLSSFVEAMDRDERLMAMLGSRMLEATKRVGETVEAIELRQSGENSVLQTLAISVSDSLSQVLRWVYWWNSTEASPETISEQTVLLSLNTDFAPKGMTAMELQATVQAWQAGAISMATMFDVFRKGEVLPAGRSDEEEVALIGTDVHRGGGSATGKQETRRWTGNHQPQRSAKGARGWQRHGHLTADQRL